jgi:hypothetical protein
VKGSESVVVFQIETLLHNWKPRSWTPGEGIESKELKSYVPAISCPREGVIVMERLQGEPSNEVVE